MPTRPEAALPDENAYVERARQGDKDAYRYLVTGYQDRLYRLVLSMVSQPALAEDLTQEIFVKAYFGLASFQGQSAFYTWLFRIAANHCLDHLRRRKLSESSLDRPIDEESAQSPLDFLEAPRAEIPESRLDQTGVMGPVLQALEPEQRLLLTLRELEGYSYEELSATLKCNVNTIKSRLNRAREALKEVFERQYGNTFGGKNVEKSEGKL